MDELGTLKDVPLRDVWGHEAQHFTPWLSEHLDLLGDAIGMGLEFVQKEVQVGSFSADILAHKADDEDHRVLIENQLGGSDHEHLGKVMTYLGGLDARTVVWVAASFTNEHLSAIKWLNEHTHEGCSFFAVRVRAARIDQSRPASLFEVVERPNAWERQQRHEVRTGLTELGKWRKRFWEHVTASDAKSWNGISPGAGHSIRWLGEGYEIMKQLDLVLYLAAGEVGIHIRGKPKAPEDQAASALKSLDEHLFKHLGVKMDNKGDYYFLQSKEGVNTDDESQWPALAGWLTEKLNLYRAAIEKFPATPADG